MTPPTTSSVGVDRTRAGSAETRTPPYPLPLLRPPKVDAEREAELRWAVGQEGVPLLMIWALVRLAGGDPNRIKIAPRHKTSVTLLDYFLGPGFPPLRVSLMSMQVFDSYGRRGANGKLKRKFPKGDLFYVAALILGKTSRVDYREVFEIVWDVWKRIERGEIRLPGEDLAQKITATRVLLAGSGLLTKSWRTGPTVKALWKAVPEFDRIFGSRTAFAEFLKERGWARDYGSKNGTRVCLRAEGGGKGGRPPGRKK